MNSNKSEKLWNAHQNISTSPTIFRKTFAGNSITIVPKVLHIKIYEFK